ncbi:imelysin family protein [Rhizobium sp. RU36D]|uniref:imelysin family protein n=1 Tax=Rhizobium sp. RU36D TaxID=1907415 RepID=UPI0009D7BA61|nr:imelysin family protein [Rhizobium sp. RU36D]SMD17043.1 hypothetical protein SAMN05880593_13131 [Rhizobium sp. RU36D]
MRLLATVIALSALVSSAAAQEAGLPPPAIMREAVPGVLERAVDGFILPGYRRLEAEAGKLEEAMKGLCDAPSASALASTQAAFTQTVMAWSTIEIVRVGPVIEANRLERVLFYPDRKSTGLKQVQALLAKPEENATDADSLKGKSVAMQGLGALEFVLYGTGSEALAQETAGFRCRYGAAISGNLEAVGHELVTAWAAPDGIQAAWKHPGPDNPVFRTDEEAITALLGILVHGAEAIRDQRVETLYKGADARPAPKQAIYWRSGNTFTSISANLSGLESLIDTADIKQLLDPETHSIVGSIDFVLKSLVRVTNGIGADVEAATDTPEGRAKLDFLLLNSRDLIVRLNDDLGGALGLGAGFSFSDGD